jgi:hypothetical protein
VLILSDRVAAEQQVAEFQCVESSPRWEWRIAASSREAMLEIHCMSTVSSLNSGPDGRRRTEREKPALYFSLLT